MKIQRQPSPIPIAFSPFNVVITVETEEDRDLLAAITNADLRIPIAVTDPDEGIWRSALHTPLSPLGLRVQQFLTDLGAQL